MALMAHVARRVFRELRVFKARKEILAMPDHKDSKDLKVQKATPGIREQTVRQEQLVQQVQTALQELKGGVARADFKVRLEKMDSQVQLVRQELMAQTELLGPQDQMDNRDLVVRRALQAHQVLKETLVLVDQLDRLVWMVREYQANQSSVLLVSRVTQALLDFLEIQALLVRRGLQE